MTKIKWNLRIIWKIINKKKIYVGVLFSHWGIWYLKLIFIKLGENLQNYFGNSSK